MYSDLSEPDRKTVTPFTPLPQLTTHEESLEDLVRTQINFGLCYAREAQAARKQGRLEYSTIAHTIASNAYSSAVRFSARLSGSAPSECVRELSELAAELDALSQSESSPQPAHVAGPRRCTRRLA